MLNIVADALEEPPLVTMLLLPFIGIATAFLQPLRAVTAPCLLEIVSSVEQAARIGARRDVIQ
jgi:hypothetical protein